MYYQISIDINGHKNVNRMKIESDHIVNALGFALWMYDPFWECYKALPNVKGELYTCGGLFRSPTDELVEK